MFSCLVMRRNLGLSSLWSGDEAAFPLSSKLLKCFPQQENNLQPKARLRVPTRIQDLDCATHEHHATMKTSLPLRWLTLTGSVGLNKMICANEKVLPSRSADAAETLLTQRSETRTAFVLNDFDKLALASAGCNFPKLLMWFWIFLFPRASPGPESKTKNHPQICSQILFKKNKKGHCDSEILPRNNLLFNFSSASPSKDNCPYAVMGAIKGTANHIVQVRSFPMCKLS